MKKGPFKSDNEILEQKLHDSHKYPTQEGEESRHPVSGERTIPFATSPYQYSDILHLQSAHSPSPTYVHNLSTIDELLERDRQREEDGFPRKIRIGRLVKPGKGGKAKIILVPTTVEEKFIHDSKRNMQGEKGDSTGGSGDGEEGDVIGEEPVHGTEETGTGGAGQGEGGDHEIESSAYDLGRILTEKFELPNLKDKGKRRSLTRYTYDLTDRHQGFGQLLDKKATLRKIVETNLNLRNIPDREDIDATRFIVSPKDKIYRVLSKEKDYESQAMVFLLRDYSGSMTGKPTDVVVTQHVLIYSWLLFQYEKQVETRFILHDTDAKEVPDFYTYYNSSVAGGTRIESAYRLVNKIVEEENLERDYNIYVFHGTDGDDWDSDGSKTVPELQKMLGYCNRIGITIAQNTMRGNSESTLEKYVKNSRIPDEHPELFRLDAVKEGDGEERLIEGIKRLIS